MAQRPGSYLFLNATILDGAEHMEPRPGMAVTIDDGRITSIVPSAFAITPPLAKVIDLHGGYLMPGLVDLDSHLSGSGALAGRTGGRARSDGVLGRLSKENAVKEGAQRELAAGTTCVLAAGDPSASDITVRDSIEVERYPGPRLLAPSSRISGPGTGSGGSAADEAATPEEARALVREAVVDGADVIELSLGGGAAPRMPLEVAREVCRTAHRFGKRVMAHARDTEGVRTALLAGVDVVEQGAPLTDELRALYRGTSGEHLPAGRPGLVCSVVPALVRVAGGAGDEPTSLRKEDASELLRLVQSARDAIEGGIPVGIGSGAGVEGVPHDGMWRALTLFQRCTGVSNASVLHSATQVNAGLAGLGERSGTVVEGGVADLVVCDADPLEDLRHLRRVRYVMVRGVLVEKLHVKRRSEPMIGLDRAMELDVDDALERCRTLIRD